MTQRKPTELKVLAGTVRPDREEAPVSSPLPRLEVVPSPPDWLTDPAAVREWWAIAPMLVNCGLLRSTMVTALGHLCMCHAQLIAKYRAGEDPKAALVANYQRFAGLFGLTPVDAKRVPTGDGKSKPNPFARFKRWPS